MESKNLPTEIEEVAYSELPNLIDRVKAMFVDAIIIILLMFIATMIFDKIEYTDSEARKIVYILLLLYEPILVSQGGTLGHRFMKLRIRSINDFSKNIVFPLSIIRYVTKALLGWISLLTVTSNKNKRAIHDMASASIVIYKKQSLKSFNE